MRRTINIIMALESFFKFLLKLPLIAFLSIGMLVFFVCLFIYLKFDREYRAYLFDLYKREDEAKRQKRAELMEQAGFDETWFLYVRSGHLDISQFPVHAEIEKLKKYMYTQSFVISAVAWACIICKLML